MSTELTPISPEGFDIANAFLKLGSAQAVTEYTGIPPHIVHETLARKDVKTYLDGVYFDQGYRNRNKLAALLDEIIDAKLADAQDTQEYTKKDLVDLIALAHKMRMEEQKQTPSATTVNVANFGQDGNYSQLMSRLLNENS